MLINYLLTIFPLITWGGVMGNDFSHNYFFSKDYTTILKGLCCLIVIYVHMGSYDLFCNPLQDAIGSFAYICVTIFFLISAFGMMKSVESKNSYLKQFWRNRLVTLLIPCLLINIAACCIKRITQDEFDLTILYRVSGYIVVLLQWCFWFYIVEQSRIKWFKANRIMTDMILIAGVVISSLLYYFFVENKVNAKSGWCFERMGLVYGILLYRHFKCITVWMDNHRQVKIAVLTIAGAILGISYLKYKLVYFWGAYLLKIILGLTLIALLFILTSNRRFGNKANIWLGSISYEIYLSHGVILTAMASYIKPLFNSGFCIVAAIILILIFSACIHAISQPIIAWLRT